MRNAIMASVAILALSAAPTFARGVRHTNTTKHMSDQEFVTEAAKANMAEIELGKLAQANGSNDQVKRFGKQMADDHQKALDSLKTVAANEKITLPTKLDPKEQELKDRLEILSGDAFDRAYMDAMVKDHHQDVAEFRAESKHAKAADVRQYASSTLPTLEEHLKLAQSIDKTVTGNSEKSSSKKAS
jgi:putative membrane protein